jgi:diguanylate cyclase (GGDEF)-like protein
MSSNIEIALLLAGAAALIWSLFLKKELIAMLPDGRLRSWWRATTPLVVLVASWHATFAIADAEIRVGLDGLVVPTMFFLGCCFVWLSARFALEAAQAKTRIAALERENVTDPLTGLFNRRYLDRKLQEEVARARRYRTPLSVLLIDIDHFKNANDRFGHDAGDRILAGLSRAISETVRETDFVARYGGEELVVIAPHTAISGAAQMAEGLRATIESGRFHAECGLPANADLTTTISVGVASFAQDCESPTALLQTADRCLYRAKRLGRNRVVTQQPATPRLVEGILEPAMAA